MSMKVYNGFKFPTGTTFEDIQKRYSKLSETEFFTKIQKLINEVNTLLYLDELDKNINSDITASKLKYNKYSEILYNQYKGIRTIGDFDCSLSFFIHNGEIYSRVFAENKFIYNFLVDFFELEDYTYWNNCDRPNHISPEEWEQRKNLWDDHVVCFFIEIITPRNFKLDFHPGFRKSDLYNKEVRTRAFIDNNIELIIEKLNLNDDTTPKKHSWYRKISEEIHSGKYPKIEDIKKQIKENLKDVNYDNYFELKSSVIL